MTATIKNPTKTSPNNRISTDAVVPRPAPEVEEEEEFLLMAAGEEEDVSHSSLETALGGVRRTWTREQLEMMEDGVRLILRGLGEDLEREGLRGTPARVARMYAALCSGHHFNPTSFDNDEQYSEMVLVRDIHFYSLCEHHLMPWFGHATIAYLPGERVLGLSKLGRVVEQFARRLQLQERFTQQIARALEDSLHPRGVAICVSAEHMCMSARGVRKPGHHTHTFALRGEFQHDPYRSEFLRLCPSCG